MYTEDNSQQKGYRRPDQLICHVYRVSYADINGTKYSKGNILLCTFDDGEPIFGRVLDIIVTQSKDCLFVLQPFIVVTFNQHYNAYEVVQLPNEYTICRHKDLLDHHVLCISKCFKHDLANKNFVCLKYHVY